MSYSPWGHKELDTTEHAGTAIISMKVLVTQSCQTLCDPVDCSPSSSSVQEILQQEYWSGYSLLQGIFPTQKLSSGLLIAGRFFTG